MPGKPTGPGTTDDRPVGRVLRKRARAATCPRWTTPRRSETPMAKISTIQTAATLAISARSAATRMTTTKSDRPRLIAADR